MPGGRERRRGVSEWAVTAGAVRCSAWLGVAVILFGAFGLVVLEWKREQQAMTWEVKWLRRSLVLMALGFLILGLAQVSSTLVMNRLADRLSTLEQVLQTQSQPK